MNFPLNSGKKRKLTVGMIIIILLGVMEPFVWLLLIPYGIYVLKKIKIYKSEEAKCFDNAVRAFDKEDYERTLEILDRKFNYEELKKDIVVMKSYCYYKLNRHREFLSLCETIPENQMEYNYTLLLAKGEALELIGDIEKAKELYGTLIKRFPKSEFLKEKLK
ncbi:MULTISPECIES: tetratricopeptide repeat protein [Clostridium]|uniref:Tetratricopeptide repeat protein n=1 Tax=Clostridium cadaveris TaxID=1529 RepID=A0A1I2KRF9_9CLOT|nr:tetratricopeptide repeat protein [Clostridium cadaveris]MDU4952803.1 hypothetical protein [Clostridium sp.]MDM8313587.1 hypothetical protein [Clostridium cadaveris]MDY4949878.1 hypothetical protein [Clostridium cadaveris]NWK10848.1 hypothetical protein [Clostridium cadaveris]UFH64240.1 hypothetical protein KQH81_13050 [Clostridium cadaveris]